MKIQSGFNCKEYLLEDFLIFQVVFNIDVIYIVVQISVVKYSDNHCNYTLKVLISEYFPKS